MTNTDDLLRRALEAEDGQPISAGERVAHVRDALAKGRAYYIDLSPVPEDQRPALIAALDALVRRAATPGAQ